MSMPEASAAPSANSLPVVAVAPGAPVVAPVVAERIQAALDPGRAAGSEPQERARIDEIKQGLDVTSQAAILAFGADPEQRVAAFADALLGKVMARDLGPVHAHLSEIRLIASGLGGESLSAPKGFIARLFHSAKREITVFSDRFASAREQIDAIGQKVQEEIEAHRQGLVVLDQLFAETEGHFWDLSMHIQAGREALDEARGTLLVSAEQAAAAGDQMAAQKVRDLRNGLELLDRKVMNLEKSRSIAFMNMPAIRQVQQTGIQLIQEMQMALAHAIPAWKTTMLIRIEQLRQQSGLGTLAAMTDFTNDQITAMAAALEQNTVEMARQTSRGIADTDAIVQAMGSLISTLDKLDALEAQARQARDTGRKQLAQAEAELRQRHLAV